MKQIIIGFTLIITVIAVWASVQLFGGRVPADLLELVQTKETTVLVDFRMPSYKKRLWVVKNGELIFSTRVSHGRESGDLYAKFFSNKKGSHMSSLGKYITANVYKGKHGLSLNIVGLDSTNNNAYDRRIVFHGANYSKLSFVLRHGRLGTSEGCFATDPEDNQKLIDLIKEGKMMYVVGNQMK